MKTSIFIVAAGAVLATAGPVNKRALETKWVEEIVTVTVTAIPTPTVFVENKAPTPAPPAPAPAKPSVAAPAPAPAAAAVEKPKEAAPAPAPAPAAPAPEAPKPVVVVQPPVVAAPPKQAPPPPSNGASNDYQRIILEQHNVHRSNHSASPLAWSDKLANAAMNNAKGCVFEHDSAGQNLASWGSSGDLESASEAAARGITQQWYNGEVQSYTYYGESNPSGNFASYGHFTQVVWKNTQRVGCGTFKCPANTVLGVPSMYTVCNYEPAGNFDGQYRDNVIAPSGMASVFV